MIGSEKMISKLTVKDLLNQINEHSSKICHDIVDLKSYSSDYANEIKLREEIAIQNECIQDILVSFCEVYLS